ncbi:hypothetical protein [Sporosarcina sp. YIM B06819]|uniref:hypothetical protein n=1 Tax=Sporosarcina sp. YIM B06819 TaxID=3081769 RepID=UPI00298CC192|nr:hypothetical protein [Sporosarcina sp. YIM B06819]
MPKKLKRGLLYCGAILLLLAFIVNNAVKDDIQEIEKALHSLNQPISQILYTKLLDRNQAIVFYESSSVGIESFGNARFKKNIFGWRLVGASSGQNPEGYKFSWSFSDLTFDFSGYTDLLSGKFFVADIKEVRIVTKNEVEYHAEIIEYNNSKKYWFVISEGEELLGSTITALSQDGKIIEPLIE